MSNTSPVLQVRDLSVAFGFDKKGNPRDGIKPVQVTDRVSFEICAGEFFALVGESGCGKSVTSMSILRLLPQPSARIVEGSVLFRAGVDAADAGKDGASVNDCIAGNDCAAGKEGASVDLAKLPLAELQKVRGSEIACIFQEPMQALNPVVTIKKCSSSAGNPALSLPARMARRVRPAQSPREIKTRWRQSARCFCRRALATPTAC